MISPRTSATLLDVLMSNLSRDEAMMPLVLGMTRTGLDLYALLVDLLDTTHELSQLKLLLSFQSHALTLWREADRVPGDLRSVLLRYTQQVLKRVPGHVRNKGARDDCLVTAVLPSLLSTLTVVKPVTCDESSLFRCCPALQARRPSVRLSSLTRMGWDVKRKRMS
jgi:hypothetical protein